MVRGGILTKGVFAPPLAVKSAVKVALEVELVKLTGNCMVGVVGRPSAFPEAVATELVLAAGTTDGSKVEAVCTEPATV